MPMPFAYRTASEDFEKFLDDLRRIAMLQTPHQTYQMLRAVLLVFRGHVDLQVAIDFAQSLPPVLRAIFIEDWNVAAPVTPFPDDETLQKEVMAIRPDHNVSTPTAIADVARALRNAMKREDHAFMLTRLPGPARRFWLVP
jgi:uncharacterized protein (DUF2267 family)